MSQSDRNCPNCGAHIPRIRAKFCEFCGTELPRDEPEKEIPLVVDQTRARFELLQDHEDLEELLAHRPSTGSHTAQMGCGIAFPIFFIAVSLGITMVFGKVGGPIAFVPFMFVVVGVVLLFSNIKKAADFSSAELEAVPALVVDERIQVSGGGENRSASTTYYAMLEFEDGRRKEFTIQSGTASKVAPNDMGVAYVKGDHLLEFRRVRL